MKAWPTILHIFLLVPLAAGAQYSLSPEGGAPTHTTFIRLANNSNAILVEPEALDPERSRIAVVISHPENINNFNYFIGRELPKRGYRAMMVNYYGDERTYDELLAPIANAIRVLRTTPGVEKIILAGHSTGGPQMTYYQDIAENGADACLEAVRIYKCDPAAAENIPRADGVMLIDANGGAPDRQIGLMPAIDPYNPRDYDPDLDPFNPANGYDPVTGQADYSDEFLDTFFAAQATLANRLIDGALVRLEKLDNDEGDYLYDEPFVVSGTGMFSGGSKPELAYIGWLSQTRAPRLLIKADGSSVTQIIRQIKQPRMRDPNKPVLANTPRMETVRSYLSFQGLRFRPDYRITEDNIYGIEWRSTPNSIVGNMEGIHVPTLIMSGTCTSHMVFHEIAYDHSPAQDKQYVGIEGANHGFMPCRPEYGDTFKRAFDFVDDWLMHPGRF